MPLNIYDCSDKSILENRTHILSFEELQFKLSFEISNSLDDLDFRRFPPR